MNKRLLWYAVILPLALLSLGARYSEREVLEQQPTQIRSQVQYDPNLSDPFYDSEEFSCPGCPKYTKCCGGKPPMKHTARC